MLLMLSLSSTSVLRLYLYFPHACSGEHRFREVTRRGLRRPFTTESCPAVTAKTLGEADAKGSDWIGTTDEYANVLSAEQLVSCLFLHAFFVNGECVSRRHVLARILLCPKRL